MKSQIVLLTLMLAILARSRGADDGAIVDGPNYAFMISAPKGWKLTSTKEIQAAFYPADTTFEKSTVIIYVRSADKRALHLESVVDLNRLDLKGVQGRSPAAVSKKVGTLARTHGPALPLYSFSGGDYCELVAYDDHPKTITVFVLSADTEKQLKAERTAFDELVNSYVFISDSPTPKKKSLPPGGKP